MAEQLEVYKCDACGNIVEVLHGGGGELVCCGEAMQLFAGRPCNFLLRTPLMRPRKNMYR
jgi:desulfoferrodoxin-like iron-binding protein